MRTGLLGVVFDAERCVALASPVVGCDSCAALCPTDAIRVGGGAFTLRDEACLACGRCVAVCPSEALTAAESETQVMAGGVVECARVPHASRVAGAVAVPCLGALRSQDLVPAGAASGMTVVDRGWCTGCPAGGLEAPWQAALADARNMAEALELPSPEVVERPLPARLALPLSRSLGDKGASRRALFRRFSAPAGLAAAPVRRSASGARKVAPEAARARAGHVAELAETAGRAVPASLFPAFRLTDACRDSGICTAVCPTEALVQVEEATATRIDFQAARCIDCGACVERCPEGAVERVGAVGPHRETLTLKRTAAQTCTTCAARFVPKAGETVCKSCTDDRELAMAGFALQRRPRAAAPHDPAGIVPLNPDRGGG